MNILTSIKTTIVGLAILGFDIYYLYTNENYDKTIFYVLLFVGIALLFSPDTLISGLKEAVNKLKNNINLNK